MSTSSDLAPVHAVSQLPAGRLPHLRDLPIADLPPALAACGILRPGELAPRLAAAVHRRGAVDWEGLGLARRDVDRLRGGLRFDPLLAVEGLRAAEDGTRKVLLRLATGEGIEVVLIQNRRRLTACLSSQAGCAFGCAFCATGALGWRRHLTAGEITESLIRAETVIGARATEVVFMGQGEPLHNYDAVMTACANLGDRAGRDLRRRSITVSTVGLIPEIRRFASEGRPWRLHLSLHAAIQATRERLLPAARRNPLPDLLAAFRDYQQTREIRWLTFQYVAIPGVNMGEEDVDALGEALRDLRVILDVIPLNDFGAASRQSTADGWSLRPPTWDEVRAFTASLRRLRCPVKVRYSAGKQEGMGCGQLSAEQIAVRPTAGHMTAPPGNFTNRG